MSVVFSYSRRLEKRCRTFSTIIDLWADTQWGAATTQETSFSKRKWGEIDESHKMSGNGPFISLCMFFIKWSQIFDPFTPRVCASKHRPVKCERACGFWTKKQNKNVEPVEWGGGVWQKRSHLTLHVPNRLEEFFPDSAFPSAAWSRLSTCEDN